MIPLSSMLFQTRAMYATTSSISMYYFITDFLFGHHGFNCPCASSEGYKGYLCNSLRVEVPPSKILFKFPLKGSLHSAKNIEGQHVNI